MSLSEAIRAKSESTLQATSVPAELEQSPQSVLSDLLRLGHESSIAQLVMQDLVQAGLGVDFENVVALSDAKRLLTEAVILPALLPEFFTGIRKPWKVLKF